LQLQIFNIAVFVIAIVVHELEFVLLGCGTACAAEIKLFAFGFALRGGGVDLRRIDAWRGGSGA
jgi:hypothetical protein